MDAWCALWFWPRDGGGRAPTREDWLIALEALLGVEPGRVVPEQRGSSADRLEPSSTRSKHTRLVLVGGTAHAACRASARRSPVAARCAREIAAREGFFHWELDSPVFSRGGFDLQLGNPPWVRAEWNDRCVLAERNPLFMISPVDDENEYAQLRTETLRDAETRSFYFGELERHSGLAALLSEPTLQPRRRGLPTNLYLGFIELCWSHQHPRGIVGLLHPTGHFAAPSGGPLREASYLRLRRLWHFTNQAKLFPDIGNTRPYSVAIYGREHDPGFLFVANVHLPETVEASLLHDGTGAAPGIKTPEGEWDRRGHKDRVIRVDNERLASWSALFDAPGTPPVRSRLTYPHGSGDVEALDIFARVPIRVADAVYHYSDGFDDRRARGAGIIARQTHQPSSWEQALLQGPHTTVARPFNKYPNNPCRSHRDYHLWDLEAAAERAIPLTNFTIVRPEQYDAEIDHSGNGVSKLARFWFLTLSSTCRVVPLAERSARNSR